MSSLLLPAYKLNLKNTQQKICVTSFLKMRKFMVGQLIERMLMSKQPSEGFFKKRCYEKFCRIYMRTSELESLFLVFSCESCKIFKNILFAEQQGTTASDYSSINSSEGSIGKRNCKL